MKATVHLATIALLFLSTVAVQSEEAGSAGSDFEAGTAAFGRGDYTNALVHFEQALERGAEGPAIHYNIAVAHYRLGNYAPAAERFALIAERYPQMRALAQYNLGLVALRQGEETAARRHFADAAQNSDVEKIRALAQRQLGALAEPDEREREWLTLLDTQLGYDDNVLLLADEVALPDGQSAESSFLEFWGLVTGPLSSAEGFRVDGNLYALRYPDASVFDQTLLQVSTPYRWSFGRWRAEVGPRLSHTRLDGNALETRAGAALKLSRELTGRTSLAVRYVRDEIQEGESRFAYLDGSRDWLELRVDRRAANGRLTLAYSTESNDRMAASVSPDRDKLSARYRHWFDSRWQGELRASWRGSRYDRLAEPRSEDLVELSAGVTRHLRRGWEVRGSVSMADNDSAVETAAYDRRRVAVGITKQF